MFLLCIAGCVIGHAFATSDVTSYTGEQIQKLLDAHETNIVLEPATYVLSEPLTVTSSVSISCSNPDKMTILDASGMAKPGSMLNFTVAPRVPTNISSQAPDPQPAPYLSLSRIGFLNAAFFLGSALYVKDIFSLSVVDCDFNNSNYECQTFGNNSCDLAHSAAVSPGGGGQIGGVLYSEGVQDVTILRGGF